MGVGIANRRPQALHRGRRYPQRTPTISMEGRGCRLAALTPNKLRTLSRRSSVDSGLRQPIGDPDPSTEVVGTHGGRRRPQLRGGGRRLATPTLN
ncbi:hypothetical protein CDL15_Pgr023801 [Punica granatum]|uniref:Uncharacterized protein n=1 Tax=Punica granatum TaxID=22663 RepID=A0A218VZU2_PUNGR|nr:hypothetical protein CDL15_Pgr023801 [Punica granatum]PKI74791.1 hypothetical protein CRG98_004809 [Punica granatum]